MLLLAQLMLLVCIVKAAVTTAAMLQQVAAGTALHACTVQHCCHYVTAVLVYRKRQYLPLS
jgi:hypothetical protein